MAEQLYPDRIATALPTGWRERCEAAAAARSLSLSAWLREQIREILHREQPRDDAR